MCGAMQGRAWIVGDVSRMHKIGGVLLEGVVLSIP